MPTKSPKELASSWRSHLNRRYGLTVEQYAAMLAAQYGRCAICRRELLSRRDTHVDHDHISGRIRGLLCRFCNHVLGLAGDSVETLRNAIAYLEK